MLRASLVLVLLLAAGCRLESAPSEAASPATAADAPRPADAAPVVGDAAPSTPDGVVVYVTEWCPYCRAAQQYLDAADVPYTSIDIESSAEAHAAYQDAGGTGGIPLIVVGQTTMEGFSEPALANALAEAGL